jgi:EAL domain-containing protein (putative c-di-GMP-specific phosphodiesterase class I)
LVRYPEDIDNQASFINFATNFHKKIDDSNRVIVLTDIANTREFKVANGIDEIINKGIANNKFEMFYQPIYSVKEKRFTSAEALIRLFDEKYGMISPGLFIPAAEESGAIHQIGDFVLDDVCRFISASDFNILGLDYIEINLSVAQCVEANLSRKIIGILDKYHVDVKQINLEITETAVAYDTETSGRNIKELVEAGISLSLDDYGTGYSNIKRVTELPIDIVKLDKSLVDEMDNPMMWVAISNTVNMLQDMGMKILVEGVEEEREFNKFVELGCDYIQGYYFSRPLPEAEFLKFIKKSNGSV